MNFDHGVEEIAARCGISKEDVRASVARGRSSINELFQERAQRFIENGVEVERRLTLIEPVVISKIDKNLQFFIGQIVVTAIKLDFAVAENFEMSLSQ